MSAGDPARASSVPDELVSGTAAETERLGEALARRLSSSDVVYLEGDLGAGKTTLVRGLARGLGAPEREVASPTFALLHEYVGGDGRVRLRHLDLYRLSEDPRELDVLGLPDAFAGAPACVEWPKAGIRELLPPTWEIRIETLADDRRRIMIRPPQP
ncbi:MAG TPA: tRNA (adenosine(37)-N6)-threonylcarbamoyltransferase complex ATPase subunit type 1 TsaE [Thermoanaerobaculia bacterium]|nr:tRNA (adenosine(37)-N6)-threonylcarbamoyltransferase complex ATPase subunit type 1 TsaE [Thermoanaerobaculia bacterium]